ncbi:hypothetical protein LG200_13510 [Methylobacillus caricis]|uniref:hypothetical protein n=1 Tax=Methylobacillus caricis TaxID=1971611 RepID=UPI001CFFCA3D|nr:hypothetical protein [Methylobacillus caricis]MCB5189021.1 hypothetical protein [Methylobacillus caricis]
MSDSLQATVKAVLASLGALLTVISLMSCTFFAASTADFSTVFYYQVSKLASTLQKIQSQFAEFGTVCIKADATLHMQG